MEFRGFLYMRDGISYPSIYAQRTGRLSSGSMRRSGMTPSPKKRYVAGYRITRLLSAQSGEGSSASSARTTACPVPRATETPETSSGTQISGFLKELKGTTDLAFKRERKTRTPRTRRGRRRKTAEEMGTTWFPRKQPVSSGRRKALTHAQSATSQEGCG
ncbi:hypothetical protein NDU88_006188 [Pleurodeles waltl]|uniref:Uncharacterized protein n=1 Tax=Pleurodeles waltl TaxID=8319 RepID=A0AAV7NUE1_PLEWA|nr:hypothetical protein NDU88_006188 [Pleurodeles waltl]